MSGFEWTGIGLTVVFGFLAYAVKDISPGVAWAGMATGAMMVLWGRLPLAWRQRRAVRAGGAAIVFSVATLAWFVARPGSPRSDATLIAQKSLSRAASHLPDTVSAARDAVPSPVNSEAATTTPHSRTPAPHKSARVSVGASDTEQETEQPPALTPAPRDQPAASGNCESVTSTNQTGGVTGCNFGTVNQGADAPHGN